MKRFWRGDIILDADQKLSDITLASDNGEKPCHLHSPLRFLSIVETARIPLHMTAGRPLHVQTNDAQSLAWFSNVLLGSSGDQDNTEERPWWESAQTDSALGILVAVQIDPADDSNTLGPRTTELLLYASREDASKSARPPTPPESSPIGPGFNLERNPKITVLALPLSSEVLAKQIDEPTPPPSPSIEAESTEARFLPSASDQPVHEPPTKKRRSAADTINDAEERRRKARRKGGQGVAAAAALHNRPEDAMPTLKHRRSVSSTQVPVQNRPLSRSSSVTSMRPLSRREPSAPAVARPSTLSQSQSAPIVPQATEEILLEQKNKDFVSKMVMAGMRMKGLKQSKSRRSRANSTAASPVIDITFDEAEVDRKNDEEFKLIYYQMYKGTCFMFRQHMALVDLQTHIGAVDEAVSQMLEMFLRDPLSRDEKLVEDEFTPGGRKLFGSSAAPGADDRNPFLHAAVVERDSKANTPCGRKEKDAT